MLMTELKSKETIVSLVAGKKVFLMNCFGCKEVAFPEHQIEELQKELTEMEGVTVTGILTRDYLCNPEYLATRLESCQKGIEEADLVLVFSCGVGVQTIAQAWESKMVCAGCDTSRLPGFQGVTPLEVDCGQCGECYLNYTGGICPITACSKSLLNGQCGGAKKGKCEVDSNMDCGWERIYRRLEAIGRLDLMGCPVQVRNYATDDEVSR